MRLEAKLIESSGLGHQGGLIGEIGEGRPTPQGQGVIQRRNRDARVDGEGFPRLPDELVEPRGVQLGLIEPQAVAGCVALDAVASDGLSEVRDVGLDDVPCLLGRIFAPDLVDQGVGGHELIRAEEEMCQDGALLRPAERYRAASVSTSIGPRTRNWIRLQRQDVPVEETRALDLLRDVDRLRGDRKDADGIRKSL